MAFRPGQIVYAAHPDEVEKLIIVERGTGGFNLKRRVQDPYMVTQADGSWSEWVYPGNIFYADKLAASIRSAEMAEEDRASNPAGRLDNPVSGGAVALAALAVAGVAWLFLRPKEASAATSPAAFTNDLDLPSLVPSTTTPAPAKITPGPALPKLNCQGKVFVTYKFKDAPPVINVFRRLTTWQQGLTPDQGQSLEERNWALSGTTSFFNIGVLDAQGWLNTTTFENHHKDAQVMYVTRRYFAEAWVETADGWCLAATDTNYEPWT